MTKGEYDGRGQERWHYISERVRLLGYGMISSSGIFASRFGVTYCSGAKV